MVFQYHCRSSGGKVCNGGGGRLVTGCNPNDLDIWTDWCPLGLQFVVYKSG